MFIHILLINISLGEGRKKCLEMRSVNAAEMVLARDSGYEGERENEDQK